MIAHLLTQAQPAMRLSAHGLGVLRLGGIAAWPIIPVATRLAPTRLTRAGLERHGFPQALCDELFAAVLLDDEVDADLRLPATIELDHDQQTLTACFRLCRQLWLTDFDPGTMLKFTRSLRRDADLGPTDRVRFKHIRAKFKHVRYAHALYGAAHRYPAMLNYTTIVMGRIQDGYRNHQPSTVRHNAALLRMLVSRPLAGRIHAENDRLQPTSTAAFRALLESDYAKLAALLRCETVTGHQFHAARKIVGRQVSFWDTLRTLDPTPDRYRMSRWLSAINGIMGSLHDRLIEDRATDPAAYRRPFRLPDDIRSRIAELLTCVSPSADVD